MKRKYTPFLLILLIGLLAVLVMQTMRGMARQRRTRAITTEFGAALRQLQLSPPGVQRVEIFVSALKSIKTDSASAEVKQALQGYADTLQLSVAAAREGRDIKQYDPSIARAKQRLIDSVQNQD
jgi:hypothetical protein